MRLRGASQVVLVVKNPPANAGDMRHGFDPWVRKISWRRAWLRTPVFLPGEYHRQRSLGLQSIELEKSDITEATKRGHACRALFNLPIPNLLYPIDDVYTGMCLQKLGSRETQSLQDI